MAHAFDRRARGAGTHRAQSLEPEREMRRVGQCLDEARRHAVGGNHVEADARTHDDAGRARGVALRLGGQEHVDLAGDVDVMGAGGEARVLHRRERRCERSGAIRDDGDAVERAPGGGRIVEPERAGRQAELRGQRRDSRPASGEHRHEPLPSRLARHELAGVTGRPIDHPRSTVRHARIR